PLIPRHTPSPLFPYTTLFRSVLAIWIALTNQTVGSANPTFVGLDNFAWAWHNAIFQTALRNTLLLTFGTELVKMLLGTMLAFLLDRKSTRLNSSHVSISYAVF